ncbi:hypothetical protein [Desulfallas thermosapovorans]|uniref:Uncharacterized protein n=1 Tax=Desulfallas thermosapovorans DSM 6562 TaxID=1121431 RepID=A0A5S4ZTB7_9FIRM|nr:hypothetical protein [Desulfallas thermosapovorans]TYO95930.1 hypothetical protein LX24_01320 [Desulfallas thermosapovorans DSM 6562]
MGFFDWYHTYQASNPILGGFIVPLYMAVFGTIFAVVADVLFRVLGIHLGEYKKEYEDLIDEQQGKA